MSYKRPIAFLTLLLSAIFGYSLYLTFSVWKIEREATIYATSAGKVDFEKKIDTLRHTRMIPSISFLG